MPDFTGAMPCIKPSWGPHRAFDGRLDSAPAGGDEDGVCTDLARAAGRQAHLDRVRVYELAPALCSGVASRTGIRAVGGCMKS